MATTPESQSHVEQFDPAALATAAAVPPISEAASSGKSSSRKSVMALALCALAINGSAAIYTLPADFQAPDLGKLAELLPGRDAFAPKPDPVLAALKEIQAAQEQQTASLIENTRVLQQNAALTQQNVALAQADSTVLLSLRQGITDERGDVKKVSSQLSTLIAKIDTLQSTVTSDVTSSIRRANNRYGVPAMRKRMMHQSKVVAPTPVGPGSVGPMSVGGAPLATPAASAAPES